RGLSVLIQAPAGRKDPAKSLAAVILPDHQTQVSLSTDGSARRIPQDRGVVVVETTVDATLRWTHDGRRERLDVTVWENSAAPIQIDCGPNKPSVLWQPPRNLDAAEGIRAARKRLCK